MRHILYRNRYINYNKSVCQQSTRALSLFVSQLNYIALRAFAQRRAGFNLQKPRVFTLQISYVTGRNNKTITVQHGH